MIPNDWEEDFGQEMAAMWKEIDEILSDGISVDPTVYEQMMIDATIHGSAEWKIGEPYHSKLTPRPKNENGRIEMLTAADRDFLKACGIATT